RLHQPAGDHRQLDPAPHPPWPGAQRLFHRRCRGRADRGAGDVDLAAVGPAGARHRLPRGRAGRRGDEGRAGDEAHRRPADRGGRRGGDVRHDQGRAGGGTPPAGLHRLLLTMLHRLARLPLLVVLLGATALACWLPAAHAAVLRDLATARAFFYSGAILLVLTILLALATAS